MTNLIFLFVTTLAVVFANPQTWTLTPHTNEHLVHPEHFCNHVQETKTISMISHHQDDKGRISYANVSGTHADNVLFVLERGSTCFENRLVIPQAHLKQEPSAGDLILGLKPICLNTQKPVLVRVVRVIVKSKTYDLDTVPAQMNEIFQDLDLHTYSEHASNEDVHTMPDHHQFVEHRRQNLPEDLFKHYEEDRMKKMDFERLCNATHGLRGLRQWSPPQFAKRSLLDEKLTVPRDIQKSLKIVRKISEKNSEYQPEYQTLKRGVEELNQVDNEFNQQSQALLTQLGLGENQVAQKKWFRRAFRSVKRVGRRVVRGVKRVARRVASGVMHLVNKVKASFRKAWNKLAGLKRRWNDLVNKIRNAARRFANQLRSKVAAAWNKAKGWAQAAVNKIKGAINSAISWVKKAAGKVWGFMKKVGGVVMKFINFLKKVLKLPKKFANIRLNPDLLKGTEVGFFAPQNKLCELFPRLPSSNGKCIITLEKVGVEIKPSFKILLQLRNWKMRDWSLTLGGSLDIFALLKVQFQGQLSMEPVQLVKMEYRAYKIPLGPVYLEVSPYFISQLVADAYAQLESNVFGLQAGFRTAIGVKGVGFRNIRPVANFHPYFKKIYPRIKHARGGVTAGVTSKFYVKLKFGFMDVLMADCFQGGINNDNYIDVIVSKTCFDIRLRSKAGADVDVFFKGRIGPLTIIKKKQIFKKSFGLWDKKKSIVSKCLRLRPFGFRNWGGASRTRAINWYDSLLSGKIQFPVTKFSLSNKQK